MQAPFRKSGEKIMARRSAQNTLDINFKDDDLSKLTICLINVGKLLFKTGLT